jgi:hypothetical protein
MRTHNIEERIMKATSRLSAIVGASALATGIYASTARATEYCQYYSSYWSEKMDKTCHTSLGTYTGLMQGLTNNGNPGGIWASLNSMAGGSPGSWSGLIGWALDGSGQHVGTCVINDNTPDGNTVYDNTGCESGVQTTFQMGYFD